MPLNDHARAMRAMPPLCRDVLLIARHAISLAALTEEVPTAALEITALALFSIPSDLPRNEWWRVGAAIKHEFGDEGFDLFDTWSSNASSYDASAARDTWRSLDADGGSRSWKNVAL